MKKSKSASKKQRNFAWLELPLICVWIVALCLYISPGSFLGTLRGMIERPMLLLLNALPVACVLTLVYCLVQNSFLSGSIVNLLFGLLNYANLLKIDGRDDPLVPADFGLLREALQATGEYRLDMHWGLLALIVGASVVMLVLALRVRGRAKRAVGLRVIGAVLAVAALAAAYFGLYTDREMYAQFPVSVKNNITATFDELGFNYCFLYNLDMYTNEKPEGFSKAEVESYIENTPTEAPEGEKPQVLVLMCEAFTDLTDSGVFTYSEEENPLHCYHEVVSGNNAYAGSMVVPNFGAGTANTEFDVISGMQTNMISTTSNSALRSFHKDIPTAASILGENGYDTFYLHPGESWFYNRNSALSHMGFESKVFKEGFDEATRLYDDAFLEKLKTELESRTKDGRTLFTYATTIQNHQAYRYSKYPFEIPKVQTNASLSAEAEEFLSVYAYGIRCSSEMLLSLTDYLNSRPEPYVLVFFGDHLPNLGADYLSYRELGLPIGETDTLEHTLDAYTVPYLLWGNDAYLDGRDMADVAEAMELPGDGRISAGFLSEVTLELAGCGKAEPYYAFLSELRREIPIVKNGIYGLMDGTLTETLSDEQEELIRKLRFWQYYRMVYQN